MPRDTPTSDSPTSSEPPIIEFKPTGAIVCPGLSFEEWQERWQGIDQASRSINWIVGDLLAYGEDWFAEQWSQVLTPQYAEQHRGAMRVSRRILIAHRRENLSWSAHREAAGAETLEERLELLDLAEANQWGSREVAAELRRRREARQHNGPPPLNEEDEMPPAPPGSTWNDDSTLGTPTELGEPPVLVALECGETPSTTNGAPDAAEAAPASPEAIRAAIAAVRRIANDIALGTAFPSAIAQVENLVYQCIRDAAALDSLTGYERAIDLIPKPWRGKFTVEFGEHVFGGRAYSVDLRKPGARQMAAGHGPSLPCAIAEAALAALLSDLGTG